ncbi:hypothetical protein Lsha_2215 [Legionella shakespearei DSM 23087]|uniref:Uncharacterized protein n=1 Tax=Legionella shakespearei DSM 23087 TaxID=1122169 RepID=A0A0W0YLY5_9GAMM|nr:hypothetical protein Lsha_2215 [Legionella shakespearei DSM 23087]
MGSPDSRRPERVFLREGSPNTGTIPHFQEILRAKRRAQDDVDQDDVDRGVQKRHLQASFYANKLHLSIVK